MPERDGYPQGVPCWADTNQPDPGAATSFYGGLFGWDFEDVMPPDVPGAYLMAHLRGSDVAAIGSMPEAAPPIPVWSTYVWVDSADDAAAKVRASGGQVLTEAFDVGDAGRMAVVADPEGAVFCVWQANRTKGSQIVNEHGSVTMNTLHTRHLDAAKAFYRSVFGWGILDAGGAGNMWTLPGYGDHLERDTPGLRQQMREMGAPEGFVDVVAGIDPLAPDQPDTPPHWSVTFAVDDADAIAAKAAELGGTVVVPPLDAPWVRMAVLADPAGATFVASQFVPENKDLGG